MLDTSVFRADLPVAHVLMVDDEEEDLFLTQLSFKKSKFPFRFTGLDSADALFDYIEDNGMKDIDVLLLDLKMPDTDGLDALKRLQKHPEINEIRSFIFSTSSCDKDRDQCVNAGADGYLSKPASSEDVKRFINTVALAAEFWI